jgi:hypothetical protein
MVKAAAKIIKQQAVEKLLRVMVPGYKVNTEP